MHEEDAFWLLVYIVETLMPPEYYSRDKQLIGAQVDQVYQLKPSRKVCMCDIYLACRKC